MTVESQSGMDFLFYLACAVCVLIVFLCRRTPYREKIVQATRKQLIWAAYGRYAACMAAIVAVLCLSLGIAYFGGRIGPGGMAAGWCIVLLMVGSLAWLRIRELRCGVQLLSRQDVETLLQGVELVRRGRVLSYVDKDWYICLGGEHTILLYAPLIDFDRAVEEVRFYTGSKLSMQSRLRFRSRIGGSFDAICTPNDGLNEWISSHGGGYDAGVLARRRKKKDAQKQRALRGSKKKKPTA